MTDSTYLMTQLACTLKFALALLGVVTVLGIEYYRIAVKG